MVAIPMLTALTEPNNEQEDCINEDNQCDGFIDCSNGEDEQNCCEPID